jgi:hypothetical protein
VTGSELSSYKGCVSRLDPCNRRSPSSGARNYILLVASVYSVCHFFGSYNATVSHSAKEKRKTRSSI